MIVATAHEIDTDHVQDVISKMQILGPPTIRVLDYNGIYYAMEGCHRIEAAAQLGITPVFVPVDPSTECETDLLDLGPDYTYIDIYERVWGMYAREDAGGGEYEFTLEDGERE